jgi:hypothetical protein
VWMQSPLVSVSQPDPTLSLPWPYHKRAVHGHNRRIYSIPPPITFLPRQGLLCSHPFENDPSVHCCFSLPVTVPDSFIMLETDRKLSNVTPKLKLVGSPVLTRRNTGKMEPFVSSESSSKLPVNDVDNALLDELPAFERHEESTAIELFYDLFFVANLTTFSNIHEISTVKELTSYIGFFCILWFTWCLTSLYDVRFVSDSLLARLAKGAHLGVMVGLAISGPKFDTTTANPQLRVMGMNPTHLDRVLVTDCPFSLDPDGLEARPWLSILAGSVPRSPL